MQVIALCITAFFIYKLKTRQTPTGRWMPPDEVRAEKSDYATKPNIQEPEIAGHRRQSDSPSGRLRYPENPDVLQSGRTIAEGY